MRETDVPRPTPGLSVEPVGVMLKIGLTDERVAYLPPSWAALYACCDAHRSAAEVVSAALEALGAPGEAADALKALTELQRMGILAVDAPPGGGDDAETTSA